MSKKTHIDVQIAKKKDLEKVLDCVLERHKAAGTKQPYSLIQQTAYNLLKKDNDLGIIWLINLDKTCIGYAVLSYGYSLEFGGRDATLAEFHIAKAHRKSSIEARALEKLVDEARTLPIRALHLDYDSSIHDLSEIAQKAAFKKRDQLRRMTLLI